MILTNASMSRGQGKVRADRKRRTKNKADAPPDDKFLALKEELFPGIPNDVSLAHIIAPMMIERPLITLPILSTVSPAWRQAMQDGLVHDARVHHQSAQTFIILKHHDHGKDAIVLLSMQGRSLHHLPPIPQVAGGIPWECRCVGLAGKIYILGGAKGALGSQEVYMWDLAVQGQWTQRAQMREGRQQFGCGVLNGKIYAFGGTTPDKTVVRGSEVYDPNSNAWSPIKRIRVKDKFDHNVTTFGEELYVYEGKYHQFYIKDGVRYDNNLGTAYGLKSYHPVQKKWTNLISSNSWLDITFWKLMFQNRRPFHCGYFVAQGKLLSISLSTIDVYDSDSKLWTQLHSFSFAAIENSHSMRRLFTVRNVEKVVVVDDELLALVSGSSYDLLLHSKGFNGDSREILWEDISPPLRGFFPEFICPLQL